MKRQIIVLSCGACSLLFMGLIYGWSIFAAPLEEAFGWTRAETSIAYTLSLTFFYAGILGTGILMKRLSVRHIISIGTVLITIGFLFASRMNSLIELYFFYGVLCGFGVGLIYNAWLSYIISSFPDQSGFGSGVLLMGFGLGGMVLGSIVSALIHSYVGWRNTFLILAFAVALQSILTTSCLKERVNVSKVSADSSTSIPPSKMILQPSFFFFTIWKICIVGIGQAIIGQCSLIMSDVGASIVIATLAVGMTSVCNGAARIIFGALFDRFGRSFVMLLLTFGNLLLSILLYITYTNSAIIPLCACLCCIGLLYGGTSVVSAAFIGNVYGPYYFSGNMGINGITSIPATVLGSTLISLTKEKTGSYQHFFPVMCILCVISAVLLPVIFRSVFLLRKKVLQSSENIASFPGEEHKASVS